MAVKRDYGSFSKACERHFAPMVAHLGWKPLRGVTFIRPRGEWNDILFFQQTQWGGGEFCVNAGLSIPGLSRYWGSPENQGIQVGGLRLCDGGFEGGETWRKADDKAELLHSLGEFARNLEEAQPWFDQFRTFEDVVAEALGERWRDLHPVATPWMQQVAAVSTGFWLLLAGRREQGIAWLRDAERVMALPTYSVRRTEEREGATLAMDEIVHEKVKGARLIKPSESDLRQLAQVRSVLASLGETIEPTPEYEAPEKKEKPAKPAFPKDPQRYAEPVLLEMGFVREGTKSYLAVLDGVVCQVSIQGIKRDIHAWYNFMPLSMPKLSMSMGYRPAAGRIPGGETILNAATEEEFDAVARALAEHIQSTLPALIDRFGSVLGLARSFERDYPLGIAWLAAGEIGTAREYLARVQDTMAGENAGKLVAMDEAALKTQVAREVHRNVVKYGLQKVATAERLTVPLLAGRPGDWKTWT